MTNENDMIHPEASSGAPHDAEQYEDKVVVENFAEYSYFHVFRKQFVLMLLRNFQLLSHYKWFVFIEILGAPLFFFLILYAFQQADFSYQRRSTPNPPAYPLSGFFGCTSGLLYKPSGCISFMFTPDTADTRAILSIMNSNNEARGFSTFSFESAYTSTSTRPSGSLGYVPVPSEEFIYDYLFENPNITQYAISFDIDDGGSSVNYRYDLWYNYTLVANGSDYYSAQLLSTMRALDEAIILYADDPLSSAYSPLLDIKLKDWPTIANPNLQPIMIMRTGNIFFLCASISILFLTINVIVYEKEFHLREAMDSMGLYSSAYYLAWFTCLGCVVAFNALFCSAFGYMFNFQNFKSTSWPIVFSNFLLFGFALISMGMLISSMTKSMNTGVLLALFPLVASLTFQMFIFSNVYFGYIWYDSTTMPLAVGWVLSACFPYFNFGRIFLDMNTLSKGTYNIKTDTFTSGPGMGLNMLYTRLITVVPDLMPRYKANGPLADPTASFQPLVFYLINVLRDVFIMWLIGVLRSGERPPLFSRVSTKLRHLFGSKSKNAANVVEFNSERWLNSCKYVPSGANGSGEADDPSVAAESSAVQNFKNEYALRIVNLRKVYKLGRFYQRGDEHAKVAVQGLCLGVPEGTCLAFLGQNGAGKTTSLSILYGSQLASAGDALVFGHSIRDDPEMTRKLMGVCPQHDVLFGDLSAVQHIRLYGGLKGCSDEQIERIIQERLALVKLDKVKYLPTRSYSGGMKRRLSVVIATIGDPKIIILDEPTTGMDPVNRRHVWRFIEQFKRERIVLLTTHSMEEADVLGDRVAVLANGQLKAVGTSLSLKNRFGSGYRISLVTKPEDTERAIQQVKHLVPEARLQDASAGATIFNVPRSSLPSVSKFIKWMEVEEKESSFIKAWGMSQTSLEEVFLTLIRRQQKV